MARRERPLMRRFQIRLSLDNDQFSMDERQEVANILNEIQRAVVLHDLDQERAVYDVNGNNIGFWGFTGEKSK
jgi:hypothetical protein